MVPEELQQRLEALADVVQRGVSIDDTNGHLVASSVHRGAVDPVRTRAILTREIPPEVARWQNTHLRAATGAVRVPANLELGMQQRIAVPLRHGGRLVGYLWILEGFEKLPTDLIARAEDAGTELAHLLAAAYQRSAENRRRQQHAVELLLSGAPIDHGSAAVAAELAPPVAVAAAAPVCAARGAPALPAGEAGRLTEMLEETVHDLATAPTRHGLLALRGHFVTLLRPLGSAKTGQLGETTARIQQALDQHLPKASGGAVAGASRPCVDLADLASSEQHARFATRVAALDPALESAVTWDRLGIFRLIADLPIHTATLEDAFPEVHMLLHARNGAMLARSVEAFLDAAGSVRTAAAVLHVHRASLYYRLERAETLTGLRLSSGHDRLTLHCGLKTARLAGVYEGEAAVA